METYREILGIELTKDAGEIEKAYRFQAKVAHADGGGNHKAMLRLNAAKQQVIAYVQS